MHALPVLNEFMMALEKNDGSIKRLQLLVEIVEMYAMENGKPLMMREFKLLI